jgi:hypothetical protein
LPVEQVTKYTYWYYIAEILKYFSAAMLKASREHRRSVAVPAINCIAVIRSEPVAHRLQ